MNTLETKKKTKANNQVNILYPTRSKFGVWSFNDADLDIVGEPFVGDINTIIDLFANGKDEVIIFCSKDPIAGYNVSLSKREELGQGMYQMDGTEIVGWLCPCLLNYLPDYVDNIYAKISSIEEYQKTEL